MSPVLPGVCDTGGGILVSQAEQGCDGLLDPRVQKANKKGLKFYSATSSSAVY